MRVCAVAVLVALPGNTMGMSGKFMRVSSFCMVFVGHIRLLGAAVSALGAVPTGQAALSLIYARQQTRRHPRDVIVQTA